MATLAMNLFQVDDVANSCGNQSSGCTVVQRSEKVPFAMGTLVCLSPGMSGFSDASDVCEDENGWSAAIS